MKTQLLSESVQSCVSHSLSLHMLQFLLLVFFLGKCDQQVVMLLNAAFISSSLCRDVTPSLWVISPMCFANSLEANE